MQQPVDLTLVSVDPTTPFDPTPPGLEYTVAMPLYGPWYWGDPNLGPDSYFNPRTYPYPADTGNFIPRWSGAFIQPRNLDPLAYQLVSEGGLGSLGQTPSGVLGAAAWKLGAVIAVGLLLVHLAGKK